MDWTNHFETAAIQALARVQNEASHRFLLDVIKSVFEDKFRYLLSPKFLNQLRPYVVRHRLDSSLAGQLGMGEQRRHHAVASQRFGCIEDFFGNNVKGDFTLLLAQAAGQLLLRIDHWL